MTISYQKTSSQYTPSFITREALLVKLFLNKYIVDKKTYILILISILPLLTTGNLQFPDFEDYIELIGPSSIFSFIIMPLITLVLGVSAIADEKENKTVSQLLSRPVTREEIVIAKWITIMLIGLVIVIIDSLILYFGFILLVPESIGLLENSLELIKVWIYLGLWFSVYATIFLFLGVWIDKNAFGLGLAIAYFEAFFSQFIFGSLTGNSPFSISNHINYVASKYLLPNYIDFIIIDFEPFTSLLICIGLILGFLFLGCFFMRKK
ncbi:ABC transporter permease subunit, partial [Candidatus Hodarchaeum mangrovi]